MEIYVSPKESKVQSIIIEYQYITLLLIALFSLVMILFSYRKT